MKVACILEQNTYQPGDPAPDGYLQWNEWAEAQHKAGLRQKECGRCGKWNYPQELSDKFDRHTFGSRKGPALQETPVCRQCMTPNVEVSGERSDSARMTGWVAYRQSRLLEREMMDENEAFTADEDAAFAEDEKVRIAALHKTAPEVIWLQIDDEAEQFQGWDAQTWCEDKINDTDLKYVRADTVPAGWIDIGTQMPPEKQSVLCCVNRCGVKVLRYEPAWTGTCAHDHSWFGETVSGIGYRVAFNVVTHWMPLPKTPNA